MLKKPKIIETKKITKFVSLQPNISNMPFDQKSPQPPEEGVLRRHRQKNRQTDGHRDSMTESAKWADSVKTTRTFFNQGLLWLRTRCQESTERSRKQEVQAGEWGGGGGGDG